MEFKQKFTSYKINNNFQANWIINTTLTKKKELIFKQTNLAGHALVIGSTGSGKTALLLNATIQIFARSQNKPSLIFSDPKGELFSTHSDLLTKQGYEVLAINLRNYQKSCHWNPLTKIWNLWFVKENQEFAREKALNYLAELTTAIFPPSKSSDSFFDDAAFSVFQFFVLLLLEKAEVDPTITKDHFNIYNIVININQTSFAKLQAELTQLSPNSLALSVGGIHIQGSAKTVTNILQTVVSKLKIYLDPIIKRITTDTNIQIDLNKAQAIFLIVPDESEAKYPFISLFVSEFYKDLIALASQSPTNSLSRRFYFLLDEFGNVPKITNITSMITVARSRNIFFMLIIQNYSQLNEKYGDHIANTIISNCAFEYFLLTSDIITAQKFSQKLGQKSFLSISESTSSNGNNTSLSSSHSEQTRALILPDELMRLNFGKFILSMQREKPIQASLAQIWKWKHFLKQEMEIKLTSNLNFESKYVKKYLKAEETKTNILFASKYKIPSFTSFKENHKN